MPSEGPPEQPSPQPEQLERITDERCLDAMKAGDFETVRAWYGAEQAEADTKSAIGRTMAQVKLGNLQEEAGFAEEALETFQAAAFDLEGIYREIPEGDERKDTAYSIWEKVQARIQKLGG